MKIWTLLLIRVDESWDIVVDKSWWELGHRWWKLVHVRGIASSIFFSSPLSPLPPLLLPLSLSLSGIKLTQSRNLVQTQSPSFSHEYPTNTLWYTPKSSLLNTKPPQKWRPLRFDPSPRTFSLTPPHSPHLKERTSLASKIEIYLKLKFPSLSW